MGKPDALSRRADHGNGASDNENVVLLRPEFLTVCALEGMELTGMEQKILSNIRKGNCKGTTLVSLRQPGRVRIS